MSQCTGAACQLAHEDTVAHGTALRFKLSSSLESRVWRFRNGITASQKRRANKGRSSRRHWQCRPQACQSNFYTSTHDLPQGLDVAMALGPRVNSCTALKATHAPFLLQLRSS